mmetsp:Transcript_8857/g.10257  ORF Transcript_8857/g.10257 Transcript_8857/m.10257 type:complete len:255 (+) Transcript_8857:421-1185(+)
MSGIGLAVGLPCNLCVHGRVAPSRPRGSSTVVVRDTARVTSTRPRGSTMVGRNTERTTRGITSRARCEEEVAVPRAVESPVESTGRRHVVGLVGSVLASSVAGMLTPGIEDAALAADGRSGEVETDFGVITWEVLKEGQGDVPRGILDTVDHYVPFPFVAVKYSVTDETGKLLASSDSKGERGVNYQVGIRDEIQDSIGTVYNMKVGEVRKFVVPHDVAEYQYRRKAFVDTLPRLDNAEGSYIFTCELLVIQPY